MTTLTDPQSTDTTAGFAVDLTRIRDQARQHLTRGPVTLSNTTDVDRVITVLNQVVASEMVCYLRYTRTRSSPGASTGSRCPACSWITQSKNSGTSSE